MSGPTRDSRALGMIHQAVSPIPIGRTLGFLSKTISRQASSGAMRVGFTYEKQILWAMEAKEAHGSPEAPLKQVRGHFHPCASSPKGPAAPFTLSAAERIMSASRETKMT